MFHRSMSAASPEQSSLGLEGGVTDDDMYDTKDVVGTLYDATIWHMST